MGSGQDIMDQMADGHSTSGDARRAETQPDGFKQSARFIERHPMR